MKLGNGFIVFLLILNFNFAKADWTTIASPSEKADKASASIMSQTKNVKVVDLIKFVEPLVSSKDFEKLSRDSKKIKGLEFESVMHGDDFFFIQAGPIKIVFKWINKDGVAFKLNGHSFTYGEAAKTELWQKKIVDVIQSYQSPRENSSASHDLNSISSKPLQASHFILGLGNGFTSMLVLPFLFQSTNAEAFNINWNSKWTWTAIGAGVVVLVANHYYRKHKKEHSQNKSEINSRLADARAARAAAVARGEQNLVSYDKNISDLENLLAEYNSSSNDVGFFGFLFGSRMSKPAMYQSIMSRESSSGGSGVPGEPIAPPSDFGSEAVE